MLFFFKGLFKIGPQLSAGICDELNSQMLGAWTPHIHCTLILSYEVPKPNM